MDANTMFVYCLVFPEDARVSYFKKQQKESGFDEKGFKSIMLASAEYWKNKIMETVSVWERSDRIVGTNDPETTGIPLIFETSSSMTGHLYLWEIRQVIEYLNEAFPEDRLLNETTGIFVKPEKTEQLVDAIKKYFIPSDIPLLKHLINGQGIEGRILFNGKSVQLSDVFYCLSVKSLFISKDAKAADEWLSKYFDFIYSGDRKTYKMGADGYKVLRGVLECKDPIINIDEKGDIKAV